MQGDYKEPVNFTNILFGVHNIGIFTLHQIAQKPVLRVYDVFVPAKEHNPICVQNTVNF